MMQESITSGNEKIMCAKNARNKLYGNLDGGLGIRRSFFSLHQKERLMNKTNYEGNGKYGVMPRTLFQQRNL